MIVGIGVDIAEVARIEDLIARHDMRFLNRVFTPREIAYCRERRRAPEHFAARLAVKEAVSKLLKTGIGRGFGWKDVEVINTNDGEPTVALHAGAQRRAEAIGIRRIHLSISHVLPLAVAFVVAED